MDNITIQDLEVDTHIGVTADERTHSQRLLVTVALERDLAEAGRTDSVIATARYDVVADLIHRVAADRPRQLVETFAEDIAAAILAGRFADAVTVEVKKFSVPRSRHVAITIRRPQ